MQSDKYILVINDRRDVIEPDGLIKTIAKTLVVSRAYDSDCEVNYVIRMIRMLKHVED
jgi:hypothetical protein